MYQHVLPSIQTILAIGFMKEEICRRQSATRYINAIVAKPTITCAKIQESRCSHCQNTIITGWKNVCDEKILGGSSKHLSNGRDNGKCDLVVVETFFLWLQKFIGLIFGLLRYYINLNVTFSFAFGHLVNLKRYRED
ncbi:hypothetical protein H4I96_04596 [Botrytis cinerea]